MGVREHDDGEAYLRKRYALERLQLLLLILHLTARYCSDVDFGRLSPVLAKKHVFHIHGYDVSNTECCMHGVVA